MGHSSKHRAEPFTLGRKDERWHFGLDCLLVDIPNYYRPNVSNNTRSSICIFHRGNEYILVANNEERRTPDLLMMACYVEDYLQQRTKP